MQYKTAAGACLLLLLLMGGTVSAGGVRGANSFLFSFGKANFEQKGTRQDTASAQGEVLKIISVKALPGQIRAGQNAANGAYVITIPLYFYPKGYNVRYGGYEIVAELESKGLEDRGKAVLNVNEI